MAPPLHSTDIDFIGPVFSLGRGFDSETGRVLQPIKFNHEVDDKMKREIEMASYQLSDDDLPEVIPVSDGSASFILSFPRGTDINTIPVMVQVIMKELGRRLKRHLQVSQDPTVGRVVYAEVEHH